MMHKLTRSAAAISWVGFLLSGLKGSMRAHTPYSRRRCWAVAHR